MDFEASGKRKHCAVGHLTWFGLFVLYWCNLAPPPKCNRRLYSWLALHFSTAGFPPHSSHIVPCSQVRLTQGAAVFAKISSKGFRARRGYVGGVTDVAVVCT